MKYLIDTNVISELYRKKANDSVINWFNNIDTDNLYISCITIAELRSGALKKTKKDKVAGDAINKWINKLCNDYQEQIIIINQDTCEIWAKLLCIDNTNAIDSLIASQAIEHGMYLVTRNIKHFNLFDMKLINPFEQLE